jgi:hypothetical protein
MRLESSGVCAVDNSVRQPTLTDITQLDTQGQPIDDLAEQVLDHSIKKCGLLIQQAIADCDRPAAVKWQEAMYEAIRSRTPAHKARLESEIMARIESPQNCYFMETGSFARFQNTGLI